MEHGDLFVRTWSDEGGGRSVAYVCRWEEEWFMYTGRRRSVYVGGRREEK